MENITSLRNTTTNQTAEKYCITEINRASIRTGFTIAYCLVFVVAVVGNSFTIYVVRTYKDMPKVCSEKCSSFLLQAKGTECLFYNPC